MFPILPTIDVANTHIMPQDSPIPPLVFTKKRKCRQTDVNANFSGHPSGKEGEGKELEKSTSASPSSPISSIYIIQHY